ncbi:MULTISPECIES: HPr family phosphocarrier protein [Sandarakinorhabdus]|uniref:HPr family phosphocarrier protein n=1 Tax=Sandarakinorhabdus TaxID=362865 RepID=UPI002357D146|nr:MULTISPECIES: HPr family phosphocarrier protein [Sandarakinorhabdus]MCM0031559.1 HPr family phosphocarrier protein [Sandarakinorhabdus limnophila]
MSETAGPVEVPITNRRGLHARASAKFVTVASSFDAEVTVSHDGSSVTGTSIMGLMMLAAAMGDSITISATGPEAEAAVSKLAGLVLDKFGED